MDCQLALRFLRCSMERRTWVAQPKLVKNLQKKKVTSYLSHNKHEFVKKVRKPAGLLLAGTQCAEMWLQNLDAHMLTALHSTSALLPIRLGLAIAIEAELSQAVRQCLLRKHGALSFKTTEPAPVML